MFDLSRGELRLLLSLNTPRKVQDFLETMPSNHEPEGDTCMSPRSVLQAGKAHCIEGAMLAALAFRLQGQRPLLLDLTAAPHDFDHVIAVFRQHGHWGAISKTNHSVLRYREPVYETIRELVLSYFHEYTDDEGKKTLRSYSRPVDLSRFDLQDWMTSDDDVWFIPDHLADVPHLPIVSRAQIATLRRADALEREAGMMVQWKR